MVTESNNAQIPELVLTPAPAAPEAPAVEEIVAPAVTEEKAPAVPAAEEPFLPALDDSTLTDAERQAIDTFIAKLDVTNPDHVLLFGSEAQKKVASFSDSALAAVKTQETGEVGEMLVQLVQELKNMDKEEQKGGLFGKIGSLFSKPVDALERMKANYAKVSVNVESITSSLENYQAQLLKDVAMFDRLYDENNSYFHELTLYIIAGDKYLAQVRATDLVELQEIAKRSGDAMDAQKANDLAAQCDRLEKKLHDLKLTRTVSMQMAPQIRLLQNNDSLLVERIQSTLSNTIPLWKSQMVLALGLAHSEEALKAQTAVTDMTNELLRKNAEKLKVGTVETAREAERGIIDIDTLIETNQSLIDTINEVMEIQRDGHTKRIEAEKTLYRMEAELKQKLLSTNL
ncbi:MAG: toxic anion resistance protein [Clostridia bacterium]|nr:toxic anion resistance protein [Clostridia bacterium]